MHVCIELGMSCPRDIAGVSMANWVGKVALDSYWRQRYENICFGSERLLQIAICDKDTRT